MYRGEYREAVKVLLAGVAADDKASNVSAAAAKQVALADAYTALGRRAAAVSAARKAAAAGRDESVLFPAALSLMATGREDEARKIATQLEQALENQPRSYARLIDAELARRQQRTTDAVDAFREAQKRHDSWWSRLLLGRMYVEIGRYAEALAELELAVKRRGEGADAFMADTPTLRYVPAAYYWLGRAQDGVRAAGAARRSYDQFLALRGGSDVSDPLVVDVRKRLAQP